ncbi:SDR family oxidoreductase [Flavobacterium aquiphilum]|uniref:SDR family oxidoreductase n=1 Tax=Flavobacterium aquiphilum TaxID=3003261 RepID=UPI00247FEA73|nr:SDR family oxidoreductase [Flavobacterium aquiphilum]
MQKTIFITGTSSGLGKATAKLFHANDWYIIAAMRNPENEMELTKLKNCTLVKLDIANPIEIKTAIETVLKKHTINVVVNNAGYGLVGPLESLSDQQITKQLNTNLLGTIRVSKEFMPHFQQKKNGLFINITSMFGLIGYPTCSVYAATKFGIDGFSESLAYEVSHLGIKVKTIAPGGIKTDFAGRSLDSSSHVAYKNLIDKVSEGYSEDKISQFSTPENIANVIYEAVTDNKNQIRYVAGSDAIHLYNERLKLNPEGQFQTLITEFNSFNNDTNE